MTQGLPLRSNSFDCFGSRINDELFNIVSYYESDKNLGSELPYVTGPKRSNSLALGMKGGQEIGEKSEDRRNLSIKVLRHRKTYPPY